MLGYHKEKSENFPLRTPEFVKPKFSFEQEKDMSRGGLERHSKFREEKYAARKQYVDKKGMDPFSIDKLRAEDRAIADAFCKSNLQARLAQAGSLVTLIKTMMWYTLRESCKFHTVFFLGHGASDVMAVGAGRVRFGEEARKVFDSNKREISIGTSGVWSIYFQEAARNGCFEADTDGRLHVFLLGCLTGTDPGNDSVVDVLASTLHTVLEMPVAVYGPTAPVDSIDTKYVLDNLGDIKRDGPAQGQIYIGEFDSDPETDDDAMHLGSKYLRVKYAG